MVRHALPPTIALLCTLALACGKDSGSTNNTTNADSSDTGAADTTAAESPTTTAAPVTTTTASDDSTSAAAGTSGGDCVTGFLCSPDAGMGGECDVFAQDCAEGDKCVAWGMGGSNSWNATKCVQVMGDKQPGDSCTAFEGGLAGLDDCDAGAFCWDVLGTQGVCVALCSGTEDAPECGTGSTCLISNGGVLNLCLATCDPLIQDCMGDDLCVPNNDDFLCSQDASGDEGQLNDSCAGGNVCDKGLLCINTPTASSACDQNSSGCCQPYCEFPDAVCPNPDQKCVQWYDPSQLPPNDPKLDIGFCGIPQ